MFTMRFDMRAPDFGGSTTDLYKAAIDMAEFFQPLVELLWNGARPSGDVDEKPPLRKRLPDLCDRAAIGTNTPVARAAERRRREIIQSPRQREAARFAER